MREIDVREFAFQEFFSSVRMLISPIGWKVLREQKALILLRAPITYNKAQRSRAKMRIL